ncbi:MAG: cyclic lactone autoinducer peptide [bacterium]|nr:cyclic lactone autoinducer peptide [bacterium]
MRNAEKFADKALKAVERIARNEVEKIVSGKTTGCATIWHQPKRPKTK